MIRSWMSGQSADPPHRDLAVIVRPDRFVIGRFPFSSMGPRSVEYFGCYNLPMLHENFVIVGALLGATGSVAYLIDTIKGKVRPNRVSFLLWSVAPFIAFAAQVKQGVGLEALMTFSTGFLPITVFVASFVNKKAEWKVTAFDVFCGVLSLVGLALWLITKVGNIAIFFSIMADGLAAVPTIIKSYSFPDTELAWPWIATSFGVALTLLTLKELTFANSGFIIYILVVDLLIFSLIQFRIGEKVSKAQCTSF